MKSEPAVTVGVSRCARIGILLDFARWIKNNAWDQISRHAHDLQPSMRQKARTVLNLNKRKKRVPVHDVHTRVPPCLLGGFARDDGDGSHSRFVSVVWASVAIGFPVLSTDRFSPGSFAVLPPGVLRARATAAKTAAARVAELAQRAPVARVSPGGESRWAARRGRAVKCIYTEDSVHYTL